MGFYGNITNTAKTQFSFDRIFPNRKEMDKNATSDGIYPGRYVLIEYDSETNLSDFLQVNSINENHRAIGKDNKIIKLGDLVENGDPFVYTAKELVEGQPLVPTKCKFYICTNYPYSGNNYDTNEEAIFASAVDSDSNYVLNYNIDQKRYREESRGYDSTVWMKTFSDGIEKYISIAELNSVVPTFAVTADAPTMIPDVPHFDTRSTDVYYELHMQPQWGFRVKEAATEEKSDETTTHQILESTGNIVNEVKNADIYYNAAGFNPNEASIDEENENYIKVEPTGKSGRKYNTHAEGDFQLAEKEDIQELSIHLPAIGNMMSRAWDIIKGPDRQGGSANSLEGRLSFFTEKLGANEIPVQVSGDGNYLIGSKINGNTSFQFNEEDKDILDVKLSDSMDSDDAWIATKVNAAPEEGEEKYNLNAISIHHTFHSVKDKTSDILEKDRGDTIDLYTPQVDKAGHVVGKNTTTVTLPYTYKTIMTNGRNDEELEKNDEMSEKITSTSADTTKDILSIDSGNYWIRTDITNDNIKLSHSVREIDEKSNDPTDLNVTNENSINIPDWTYDKAGHIRSKQDHYYTLPFSYSKIKGDNDTFTEATVTWNELNLISGDSWLETEVTEDTVTFIHTDPVGEKDSEELQKDDLTPSFGDTFTIEDWYFDDKGHKYAGREHTVKIPQGELKDNEFSGSDVITQLNFESSSGKLTTDRANISQLKLNGYELKEANDDINAGNTLAQALSSLQVQIHNRKAEINTEAERATAAETKLEGKINTEAERATAAETKLEGKINAEATRATVAEAALEGKIGAPSAGVNPATGLYLLIESNASNISAERLRAEGVEAEIEKKVDDEVSRAKDAEAKIETEIGVASDGDELATGLYKLIEDNKSAINEEKERAIEVEEQLKAEIGTASEENTPATGLHKLIESNSNRISLVEEEILSKMDANIEFNWGKEIISTTTTEVIEEDGKNYEVTKKVYSYGTNPQLKTLADILKDIEEKLNIQGDPLPLDEVISKVEITTGEEEPPIEE